MQIIAAMRRTVIAGRTTNLDKGIADKVIVPALALALAQVIDQAAAREQQIVLRLGHRVAANPAAAREQQIVLRPVHPVAANLVVVLLRRVRPAETK